MTLSDTLGRNDKSSDKLIAKKSKESKKSTSKIKNNILDSINLIKSTIDSNLGKYKLKYKIISDKNDLIAYMQQASKSGFLSIDTETTGLDPISDKIVGLCLYTPNDKPAYIPINHISYITEERLDNQLTENEVKECLEYNDIIHDVKIIMHNAAFDIRVLRNQLNVFVSCYWDCYLAARLMNENEPSSGLKALHQKYVLEDNEDEFSFNEFFKGITFDKIPIDCAYLYAAHDAIITYELYEFQKQYLYYDQACLLSDRNGMNGVSWVFFNIEMPCIDAVVNMEDTGIKLDTAYAKELSNKYKAILDTKLQAFYDEINKYNQNIESWRSTAKNASKLGNPINIASPTQLAILLYDILKLPAVDKKFPRGTGVEILKKINHPICSVILEYREIAKLLSTYIDKLPTVVKADGRVHCKFNQYGADTGRFSSNDPNLQNIPSHNKDIRKMFIASDDYVLMSSDYSQQEPKCLAALCKLDGDSQMYNTFMAGKDLYSEIASKAFNVSYEDCLEFNPDGTTNKEGKERRRQAKSILLGVLYGRGEASIAEQLNCSVIKAQQIKRSVFKSFPAIENFENASLKMAYNKGYVTTICGRKRRLFDLWLDEFEFKWVNKAVDVLDFDNQTTQDVPLALQQKYLTKLKKAWGSQKRAIFEEAKKEGIWIIDNGLKIASAERQCVNARIQGSAADLTKLALIKLNNNLELKKLGFRLLIPVHDEVIAECPKNNAKVCAELLAKIMSDAAEEILQMPIKCDVEITKQWYGEPYDLSYYDSH